MKRPVGLAVAALMLAGCANGTPDDTGSSSSVFATLEQTPGFTEAAEAPPLPLVDSSLLDGLGRARAKSWLGTPDLYRSDPPVEVWQYCLKNCVLELYYFEGQSAVAYYTARPRALGVAFEEDEDFTRMCLNDVIYRQRDALHRKK
ncbi:MAG: hypothetical protein U9N14_03425 [Pseudomonadota bacterium]|nr:hypothetical protein [Pseudomonadota bacterium]